MKTFKSLPKIRAGAIVALAVGFASIGLLQVARAGTGQLFLSPGSASVQNGSNVTLSVRINTGAAVDGVEATVNYDKNKLQFASINSSNSAFPIQLVQSGGGGTVQLTRGILGSTVNSSNALIANVTFKALVGSGSTSLSVSGNATSGGSHTDPAGGSATVSFTSPSSSPSPSPTPPPSSDSTDTGDGSGSGDSSGGSSPSDSSGGTDSKKEFKKFGLDIKKQRIEFTRAILKATAKQRVRVCIQFGTQKDQLAVNAKCTDLGTEHNIALDEKLLIPGTTFYYKVIAEDAKGNKIESKVESFKTKGYSVRLILADRDERPLANKEVNFFSDPVKDTTNKYGLVEFEDVSPGIHRIEYKQGGKTYSEEIQVNDVPIFTGADGTQTSEEQSHNVFFQNLSVLDDTPGTISPVVVAAVVVAAAGAGAFIILRRKLHHSNPAPQTPQGTPQDNSSHQPDQGESDELISKVAGLEKPDPGSVVPPNEDKDKE